MLFLCLSAYDEVRRTRHRKVISYFHKKKWGTVLLIMLSRFQTDSMRASLRKADIKGPTLSANVSPTWERHHAHTSSALLDYDSVALAVLMIAISVLELLVL